MRALSVFTVLIVLTSAHAGAARGQQPAKPAPSAQAAPPPAKPGNPAQAAPPPAKPGTPAPAQPAKPGTPAPAQPPKPGTPAQAAPPPTKPPAPTQPPPAAPGSGQATPAPAPQGVPGSPAAAPAAPAPQAPPETYTYRPEGRRDPFLNLIGAGTETRVTSRKGEGPSSLTTSEITVRGILQSRGALVAMIQGPDKKTYIVHQGDKLLDGTIKTITPEGLVVVQEVNDPLSLVKQREIRKLLRSLEDAKE